jgi:hypothetical protein
LNNSLRSTILIIFLIIVGGAILAGLTWGNYNYSSQNPGGNDFLVHWVGTQELIMKGVSPYADEVALRIQTLAYGRPAQPGEHELRVAYPIYSTIFFAPFAIIENFTIARAVYMTFLEVCIFLLSLVCISLSRWRPGLIVLFIFFLFSVFWYHAIRPLINGNAVIFVALLITAALWAIRQERDEFAGILLGFATIKPQVVILVWIFITLWAISKKRWRLLIWSYGTVAILSVIGFILVPGWLIQNFYEILRYPAYNPPGTPGAAFSQWFPGVGRQLGWGLTLVTAVILLIEWVLAWGKEYDWFLWTACLTLTISQWIGIQTDPGNFIVLLFPLVLFFVNLENRWGKIANIFSVLIMIGLLIGLWALFLATVQFGGQPVQHPIMFFPLPFVVLCGLYWVRWWAIRPRRPLVEAMKAL